MRRTPPIVHYIGTIAVARILSGGALFVVKKVDDLFKIYIQI